AREENNVVSILVERLDNGSPTWVLTTDSGATWSKVALPYNGIIVQPASVDNGGPFVRSKYSNVRIGTRDVPFVIGAGPAAYGGFMGRRSQRSAADQSVMGVLRRSDSGLLRRVDHPTGRRTADTTARVEAVFLPGFAAAGSTA